LFGKSCRLSLLSISREKSLHLCGLVTLSYNRSIIYTLHVELTHFKPFVTCFVYELCAAYSDDLDL